MKISKKNIVKLFVVFLSSWNQGANPISACTSWPFLTDKGFDICDVKPNRVVGGKINDRLEACNLRPYCPCGNVTVFMRTILLTVLNLKVLFILVYLFTLSGDTPDTDLTQQRLLSFFRQKYSALLTPQGKCDCTSGCDTMLFLDREHIIGRNHTQNIRHGNCSSISVFPSFF